MIPRYKHHCPKCLLVDQKEKYDIYFCRDRHRGMVLEKDGQNYIVCLRSRDGDAGHCGQLQLSKYRGVIGPSQKLNSWVFNEPYWLQYINILSVLISKKLVGKDVVDDLTSRLPE